MNAQTKIVAPTLEKLREPFPDNQISKLPKETRAQSDDRKARKQGCMVWKCPQCGGAHHKDAVHLDYVGHAALTDRLLDTDPEWSWEPVSFGPDGLPALDRNGGLWIRLTVLGVTRLGYGDADGKTGGNAVKEAIGDALRNAAMRFGAALDLWHKGDLHADETVEDAPSPKEGGTQQRQDAGDVGGMPADAWAELVQLIEVTNTDTGKMLKYFKVDTLRKLSSDQHAEAVSNLKNTLAKMAKEETNRAAAGEPASDGIDY